MNLPALFRSWLVVCVVCLSASSSLADVRIDPGSAPDADTAALAQALRNDLAALPARSLELRITVGLAAFRQALASPDKRSLLATYLTSSEFYEALGDAKRPDNVSAVFSNPDPSDQVALAETLLGNPSLALFDSTATHHLMDRLRGTNARAISVNSASNIDSLLQATSGVNAVVVLPDATIFNRTNIGYIVRVLYQRRAVLIGYSQTLSRAGALASVYVAREAMTAQILASVAQADTNSMLPSPVFVRDVSIAVNEQLAHSLNLAVPPMVELMNRIKKRQMEGDR